MEELINHLTRHKLFYKPFDNSLHYKKQKPTFYVIVV